VITATEEPQRGLSMGCFRFLTKPVSREQIAELLGDLDRLVRSSVRRMLVLEDDPAQQMSIAELLRSPKVEIKTAGDAEAALALLDAQKFDCLLLDLRLPGRISGDQLLEK